MSQPLSPVAAEFLAWAADDFVEVFCLRDVLRRLIGALTPEEEKEAGLAVLQELFAYGLLRVGEMRSDVPGLVYWDGPPPELIERIKNAWSIQDPPAMGEPPWFSATEAGERAVKAG